MKAPPPSLLTCALSPPTIPYHPDRVLVGCCVTPYTGGHLNPRPCPSLFFHFFVTPFDSPKRWVNILLQMFGPVISPYRFPHQPPTLFLGWLLRTCQVAATKFGDLPIFQVYDGYHIGTPNKGISCSKHEPDNQTPALDP